MSLNRSTGQVFRSAILFDLRNVPIDGLPSLNLFGIFDRESSTHIVTAIPLEPSARIVLFVDPSFFNPHLERLAGVFMEIVQRIVVMLGRKLSARKPILGKFFFAVGHVLAAKNSKREHLLGSKFRFEIWIKVPADWLDEFIFIAFLELVAYFYDFIFHILTIEQIDDEQSQAAPPADIGHYQARYDFVLPDSRE